MHFAQQDSPRKSQIISAMNSRRWHVAMEMSVGNTTNKQARASATAAENVAPTDTLLSEHAMEYNETSQTAEAHAPNEPEWVP